MQIHFFHSETFSLRQEQQSIYTTAKQKAAEKGFAPLSTASININYNLSNSGIYRILVRKQRTIEHRTL